MKDQKSEAQGYTSKISVLDKKVILVSVLQVGNLAVWASSPWGWVAFLTGIIGVLVVGLLILKDKKEKYD